MVTIDVAAEPRRRAHLFALLATLLAGLLVLPLLPGVATAQTSGDDGDEAEDDGQGDDGVDLPDDLEEIDAGAFEVIDTMEAYPGRWWDSYTNPAPLIFWPSQRRAYQFGGTTSGDGDGVDHVVAYDLDTLAPVTDEAGERLRTPTLSPPGPHNTKNTSYQFGQEQIALDEQRGVMFLPHQRSPASAAGPCFGTDAGLRECIGGIHVIDLADDALEPLPMEGPDGARHDGRITFQPLGVDGPMQSPVLRAMSYTDWGGDAGKLHLLVQEAVHQLGPVDDQSAAPRDWYVPHWVVQIDVTTGRTDWVESAPGCQGYRQQKNGRKSGSEPSHAIFVNDDHRRAYVGCYARNGIGNVGVLELDPDDPEAAPTTTANYPGPAQVASIQADPAAERLWLRSHGGGDHTWWYFDGQIGNYLGVVGIGELASASDEGEAAMGTVDASTGRLYVLDVDAETNDGRGLYVTDGRRVPVPQAGVVRDFPWEDLLHHTVRDEETGEIDYQRDEEGERTGRLHGAIPGPLVIDPAAPDEGRPRRVFVRPGRADGGGDDSDEEGTERWYVLADRRQVHDQLPDADAQLEQQVEDPPPTDDVELADDLTSETYLGTARGYGLRTLWLGGADAVAIPGGRPYDEYRTQVRNQEATDPSEDARSYDLNPCGGTRRQTAFGLSGSLDAVARLQRGGSSGLAIPQSMDNETERDVADPVGRCGEELLPFLESVSRGAFVQYEGFYDALIGPFTGGALDPAHEAIMDSQDDIVGLDPADEVRTPGGEDVSRPGHEVDESEASCSAPWFDDEGQAHPSDDDRTGDDRTGDDTPAGSTFTAEVRCEEDRSTDGRSRARFLTAGPVSVLEAGSEYDLVRDTETGGLVATGYAYARGITIVDDVVGPSGEEGTSRVTIDLVETRAEAWAEGRSQPEGVDDECDRDRTAGTCIERTFNGVTIVDGLSGETYRCHDFEECDQKEQMADAMDAALGGDWMVDVRSPDALLARGMPNGTQAAVQKREIDEFADVIMNGDLLKTLPALEMVRFNDNSAGRGRQVYQFAGVELGTTYTRQCRGVIEGELCVQPDVELAEVDVTLTDAVDGTPLPDGVFGLHRDDEGTLSEGLDALPGERTCTTDEQGQCSFVALEPGAYTLVQAGAPGDYSPTDEQVPLNLSPGSLFEVDVTNVREIGEVEVTLTDLDEQPLEGGVFELYADADTDGAIGLDDPQAATCTTGPGGTCTMSGLPLDAYVLRQAAAPEGYAPVEDEVPFALDAPGQVATVGFSNAPALPPSDDGGAGDAVDGSQQAAPPQQGSFNGVERTVPMPVHQPVAVQGPLQPQVASDSGSGGPSIIQQMKDAPGDAIRMIRRSPREAAGFAALVLLAGAAVNGPVRRRLLTQTMA